MRLRAAIAFVILTGILTVACGQQQRTVEFTNEPQGFRELKWGTPIDQLPDMVVHNDSPLDAAMLFEISVGRATRDNDDLRFADTTVSSINYFFTSDLLTSVTLMVYSEEDFQKLKEICFATYGPRQMSASDEELKRVYQRSKYERYTRSGTDTVIDLRYTPDPKGSYYGRLEYSSKADSTEN